ncbi:MAG: hypothetical protein JWM95_5248 [Gemmatimonadetes bacterium]|nr:hypothetical protein [Gemmatimonadota bacterium]
MFVLDRRALTDAGAWVIFMFALAIVLRTKRLADPVLILAAGLVGIALRG